MVAGLQGDSVCVFPVEQGGRFACTGSGEKCRNYAGLQRSRPRRENAVAAEIVGRGAGDVHVKNQGPTQTGEHRTEPGNLANAPAMLQPHRK